MSNFYDELSKVLLGCISAVTTTVFIILMFYITLCITKEPIHQGYYIRTYEYQSENSYKIYKDMNWGEDIRFFITEDKLEALKVYEYLQMEYRTTREK